MSVLDRATLEGSTLADLHAIASELGVDGYRRLRKADLIETLLEHQEPAGADAPEPAGNGAQGAGEDDDEAGAPARGRRGEAEEEDDEAGGTTSRRRRGRRGGRGRGSRAEDPEERPDEPGGDRDRGDRDHSDRGERGDRGERAGREREQELVEGIVELLPNGSAFLRVSPPEPSEDDVYISAAQVKRCELINGDRISGPRRTPHRSERYSSLVRVDSVNGTPAAELADRAHFDDLPARFPAERFKLGSGDETLKAIEFLTPFGRGSRVTICGGAWAGKSHTLRGLAELLAAAEELTVLVALAGVRPEEIAEWGAGPVAPGAAVSFAVSAEAQDNAVELVLDQARRLAARGVDAVALIDTLDGLHPLSARKALASARNIVDGGSLTVIATSTAPLGGETTLISLDARLATSGRYPALDLAASGTLRPELLVGDAGAKAIAKERAKALK